VPNSTIEDLSDPYKNGRKVRVQELPLFKKRLCEVQHCSSLPCKSEPTSRSKGIESFLEAYIDRLYAIRIGYVETHTAVFPKKSCFGIAQKNRESTEAMI
jgi:hypothetical protein